MQQKNHKKRITSWEKPSGFDESNSKRQRPSGGGEGSGTADENLSQSIQQVRARHILLKHDKSRNPISWRNEDGKPVKLTKEEAHSEISDLLERLVESKQQYSDM
jgi:asparagine synthetase B (glutamine-hydrolysing)